MASTASVGSVIGKTVGSQIAISGGAFGAAWRRLKRNKPATVSAVIVILLILVAIFAPVLAPYGYDQSNIQDAGQFPNAKHLLGTDLLGRDLLSRLIYATRASLLVAFAVQLAALLVGVPFGFLAGLKRGVVENVLNAIVMVFNALPGFLFALFLVTALGSGIPQLIFALMVTTWIGYARIMRAEVLRLRNRDFVLAAQALGAGSWHIALRHLLPNSLTALIIAVALGIPGTIYAEAGLSFLGLGIRDPIPSWGKMISDGIPTLRLFWHLILFPLLALSTTTLSFMFLADALRDALDPSRGKR
ncbi:MAG: ABC transporter permease [Chloroflexi bacterium]|jgi:ABC-type dipeptide/oligopeptide/nickel transport system permease subunit|uniref:Peptide ABC transporter permease n=1 Tax=Candidatus Thermofonsia Clade 3 bacterium TaxID=2364212 RepID=A0A2M8QF71_9CHLR|nr:ABC transporter permease [Candidatus Roseilinea sp. NK_OTU-006]PJF48463.1 MAG: peptide ABC transporter permease [Candidatus Thermofonsia Clade 3 bacterium]RMG66171.1 MAG: ABC transporter permease [Chloroflexota bacterium]